VPLMWPAQSNIRTGGSASGAPADFYTGFVGPASFGSGGVTTANSSAGDYVGIQMSDLPPDVFVPHGYVSGNPLSDTSIYDGQTFSSLGVTPGTYKWTWGRGANQNFTLVVGTVVPEPSTWAMMLIGFAGLGLIGYRSAGRRRRSACNV
jgi:PEP-CTERM motif